MIFYNFLFLEILTFFLFFLLKDILYKICMKFNLIVFDILAKICEFNMVSIYVDKNNRYSFIIQCCRAVFFVKEVVFTVKSTTLVNTTLNDLNQTNIISPYLKECISSWNYQNMKY